MYRMLRFSRNRSLKFEGATTSIASGNPIDPGGIAGFADGGITGFEIIPGQPAGTVPPNGTVNIGGTDFTVTQTHSQANGDHLVVHLAGGTTQPLFQSNGTTPLTATDIAGLTGANAYVAGGDDLATYITDNSAQPNTSVDLSAPPAVDPAVRLKFSSAVTPNSSDNGQYEAGDFAVALVGSNDVITYTTATSVENDPNEPGDLIIEASEFDDTDHNVASVAYDMAESSGVAADNAITCWWFSSSNC